MKQMTKDVRVIRKVNVEGKRCEISSDNGSFTGDIENPSWGNVGRRFPKAGSEICNVDPTSEAGIYEMAVPPNISKKKYVAVVGN